MIKKKYSEEEIEKLTETQVFFFDYDAKEDCYVSKWSIKNYSLYGIYPLPKFDTKDEAIEFFRTHLTKHFKK